VTFSKPEKDNIVSASKTKKPGLHHASRALLMK